MFLTVCGMKSPPFIQLSEAPVCEIGQALHQSPSQGQPSDRRKGTGTTATIALPNRCFWEPYWRVASALPGPPLREPHRPGPLGGGAATPGLVPKLVFG